MRNELSFGVEFTRDQIESILKDTSAPSNTKDWIFIPVTLGDMIVRQLHANINILLILS